MWVRFILGRNPGWTLLRILVVILLVLIVFKFVLLPIRVTGHSMWPTFHNGEIKFVNRLSYLRQKPKRGDIVAVEYAGGVRDSLDHSEAVTEKLEAALAGSGLGVDPLKADLVAEYLPRLQRHVPVISSDGSVAVPEPATAVLLGFGLLGLAGLRRRHRTVRPVA